MASSTHPPRNPRRALPGASHSSSSAVCAARKREGFVANFAQDVMKGQLPWSVEELRGQCVEQFGRSAALVSSRHDHLSFFDHVHEVDPDQSALRCIKRFEPQHRPCHALDGSMILLDHIMQIFDLTNGDGRPVLCVGAFDGRFIGVAAVNRDRFGETVPADGLLQEASRGVFVPVLRQQKVNGFAVFVDSTVQIFPLAFHSNIGFVHAPAEPHRPLAAVKGFL